MSGTDILIHDENLRLGYGGKTVVASEHGAYRLGERWILSGPNASGKSTFLKAVLQNHLTLSGLRRCEIPSSQIAFLEQMPRLSWSLPCHVEEFLLSSLAVTRAPWKKVTAAENARARELLRHVGLQGHEKSLLAQLSGGQVQRLLLARALFLNAKLLLLDEPFSAVDEKSRQMLWSLLDEVRDNTLQWIVLHDPADFARAHGRRLSFQEGRVTHVE